MTEGTRAFVPGHVTGFFTSDPHTDPTKAGSRGCGIGLSDGVTVTVRSAENRSIRLDGDPIEMEPVERVLGALGARATVTATADLPLGAGFGVSGAVTLGTALAANEVFDCRLSENELVTVAHGAEVQSGTGLGDVVAQARGGVALRLEPGGPHEHVLDGIPARGRVEYHVIDDLSTGEVLEGETEGLTAAGEVALSRVVSDPTMETFMRASREFARESELLTPAVRDVVTDVTAAGGTASMAMLGEAVFAPGTGLSDAGYDPGVCAIDPAGARLAPRTDSR